MKQQQISQNSTTAHFIPIALRMGTSRKEYVNQHFVSAGREREHLMNAEIH